MTEYPLPVADLDGKKAVALICPDCEFTRDATEEEIGYSEPENFARCGCGAGLTWKYAQADKCPGCGRLGWWNTPAEYEGACSRPCHLQVEYARQLGPAP